MMKEYIAISTDLWISLSGYLMSFRESGGSERKSGAPDFFRSPCGAKADLSIPVVYFTPRFIQLKGNQYTWRYTRQRKCVNDGYE